MLTRKLAALTIVVTALATTTSTLYAIPASAVGGVAIDGGTVTVSDSSPGGSGDGGPGSSNKGGRGGKYVGCVPFPIPPGTAIEEKAESTGMKPWSCQSYIMESGLGVGIETLIWSADNPATADPETVAQEIVTSMDLSALPLSMVPEDGPGVYGLVGLPVWFWTPANQWSEKSKSKASGGLNVSVTAKVDRVVVRPGDGSTETCMGPGTKYQASYGIKRSPDCGHTYEKTSGAGRKFSITATTYWKAQWTGGGQSGTIDMDFSTSTRLGIGEAQALRQ